MPSLNRSFLLALALLVLGVPSYAHAKKKVKEM